MSLQGESNKKIKFGILSTARISKKLVWSMHESSEATPLVIASRELSKAQAFAHDHLVQRSLGSYRELMHDPEIDAIYISVPTTLKRQWAIEAASQGKHVLVDKPFASEADLMDMIHACEMHGVLFMDGTHWVHHERAQRLRSEVLKNNGETSPLGTIKRVHCAMTRYVMPEKDKGNIRFKPELEPLGAIGDLLWYSVKGALFAMNWELPKRVFATGKVIEGNIPIDATGIMWWFNAGNTSDTADCTATVVGSFDNVTTQVFEVVGDEARLSVGDGAFFPFYNDQFEFPDNTKNHERDPTTHYVLSNDNGNETKVSVQPCTQHVEMINTFSRLVKSKQREKFGEWAMQTRKTQRVIDALYKSCLSKSVVDIQPISTE